MYKRYIRQMVRILFVSLFPTYLIDTAGWNLPNSISINDDIMSRLLIYNVAAAICSSSCSRIDVSGLVALMAEVEVRYRG